jgi:hypothetical protein
MPYLILNAFHSNLFISLAIVEKVYVYVAYM